MVKRFKILREVHKMFALKIMSETNNGHSVYTHIAMHIANKSTA